MSTLGILVVIAWLLTSILPAHSAPEPGRDCDSSWGQNSLTPPPVSSPPINTPSGYFSWGAHVYLDGYGRWWTWNFVRNLNDPKGTKLPFTWEKGRIARSTLFPLEGGSVACSSDFIDAPAQIEPVIDPNAPIEYGINRVVQGAVVFQKPPPTPVNGPSNNPPAISRESQGGITTQPLGTDPATSVQRDGTFNAAPRETSERKSPTISILQTSYRDANDEKQHIRVLFSSDRTSDRFEITIQKEPENLVVGVSDFLKALNKDQAAQIESSFKEQGIQLTQGSLGTFAGPEAREAMFLTADDPLLSNGLLFIGTGPKLVVSYSAPPSVNAQRRQALLIVFDADHRPIAAKRMDILIPEQMR